MFLYVSDHALALWTCAPVTVDNLVWSFSREGFWIANLAQPTVPVFGGIYRAAAFETTKGVPFCPP